MGLLVVLSVMCVARGGLGGLAAQQQGGWVVAAGQGGQGKGRSASAEGEMQPGPMWWFDGHTLHIRTGTLPLCRVLLLLQVCAELEAASAAGVTAADGCALYLQALLEIDRWGGGERGGIQDGGYRACNGQLHSPEPSPLHHICAHAVLCAAARDHKDWARQLLVQSVTAFPCHWGAWQVGKGLGVGVRGSLGGWVGVGQVCRPLRHGAVKTLMDGPSCNPGDFSSPTLPPLMTRCGGVHAPCVPNSPTVQPPAIRPPFCKHVAQQYC